MDNLEINLNNYFKLKSNSSETKKKEIYEKVKKKEIEWAFFTVEGNLDVHYYKPIN